MTSLTPTSDSYARKAEKQRGRRRIATLVLPVSSRDRFGGKREKKKKHDGGNGDPEIRPGDTVAKHRTGFIAKIKSPHVSPAALLCPWVCMLKCKRRSAKCVYMDFSFRSSSSWSSLVFVAAAVVALFTQLLNPQPPPCLRDNTLQNSNN